MNRISRYRTPVLMAALAAVLFLTPLTAHAYINCYSYGPGGILLGPCEAGAPPPPSTCSIVPYANDPVTQGKNPGLRTRFLELGSDDFDAVAITLPEGSNRGAFPKGAPAKGAAAQTLESLFAAADKIGEGSDGDGVLLIFEKGVLDGLSPDGASVEELLDLSASARSITGYYVHR